MDAVHALLARDVAGARAEQLLNELVDKGWMIRPTATQRVPSPFGAPVRPLFPIRDSGQLCHYQMLVSGLGGAVALDVDTNTGRAPWRWEKDGRCVFSLSQFQTASDFRVSGAVPGTRMEIADDHVTLSTATVDHSGCCTLPLFLLPRCAPHRPLQLVAHDPTRNVHVVFTTTMCCRGTYDKIHDLVHEGGGVSLPGVVQGWLYTYHFTGGGCVVRGKRVVDWLRARELGRQ